MAKRQSCAMLPKRGVTLFSRLKSEFGYPKAREIFVRVITPQFITEYKDSLSLNAEGIPSFESVIALPIVKEFIGEKKVLDSLNKSYKVKSDTRDSYKEALVEANNFNTQSSYNNDYIATVIRVDNGLKVSIVPKTEDAAKDFTSQYSSMVLSDKLVELFKPLGLTVGTLSSTEVAEGRVGAISFDRIKDIAQGFSSIIKVANNMEGSLAIPEEFSHLLVRMFYNNTLVQRSLSYLRNNQSAIEKILGDKYESYNTTYNNDIDKLAEEALGQVLHKELLNMSIPVKTSIFTRLKEWIIKQFSQFSSNSVDQIIYESEKSMSILAKNILSNPKNITQEQLEKASTDLELNALSTVVDKKVQLLNKILQTEAKRKQIGSKDSSLDLTGIRSELTEGGDKDLAIFRYLYHALEKMNSLSAEMSSIDHSDSKDVYAFLRAVRMYMKSYGAILKDLDDILIEGESQKEDGKEETTYEIPGEDNPVTLAELVQRVNALSNRLERRWAKSANTYLVQFLTPHFDSKINIEGKSLTLEEVLATCPSDISFSERWLDALSDSSDPLLQLIDTVVKEATATIRDKHIRESRKIIALRKEMEAAGITSTDWMYERDEDGNLTGSYISEIDYPAFYKARKEFIKYLDAKYGTAKVGKNAVARNAEMREWNKENTSSSLGLRPSLAKYRSKAYANLSVKQKEILQKGLALKEAYDAMYPKDRTKATKAIQIRRSEAQRVLNAITSPTKAMEAVKEQFAETFARSTADEDEFGTATGLRDFDGTEFFALPVLYTNSLKNANELSTDFFSTLLQYSYATLRYDEMSKVVDPLEVTRVWVKENRVTTKTRGGKVLQEAIKAGKDIIKQDIYEDSTTNISQRLDDYYASQLYSRMMKEGTEIVGINTNKAANKLMGITAMASLSFNWLAQIANVFNGIAMQNVETRAKQFFTAKSLLKADAYYTKHLGAFFKNLGSRDAYDPLSLIGEFFNIKQDYDSRIRRTQNHNLIQRALGSSISFIGQEAGDHWLYYRTALAMLHETKVNVPGKGTIPLIDALVIKDSPEGKGMKEMIIPEGTTNLDGTAFNPHAFGRKIAKINHGLFGIYNTEDSNAAHRTAVGRLALQFRKWMKPLLNKRFQSRQYNMALESDEEGWYRTVFRFLKDLYMSKFQVTATWDSLEDFEKQNLKRAFWDTLQVVLISLVGFALDLDDDDKKSKNKTLQLTELVARRLSLELRALHPMGIFDESRKLIRSPFAAMSTINSIYDILSSIVTPTDWTNELQSGPYKGMSTLQKNLYKAPVWGLSHFRQVSKFIGDTDDLINYYARPY